MYECRPSLQFSLLRTFPRCTKSLPPPFLCFAHQNVKVREGSLCVLRGPRPVLTVPGVAGAPSPVLTVPRVYGAPALSSPSHVMQGPRPVLIVPRVAGLPPFSPSHVLRGTCPFLTVPYVAGPPPCPYRPTCCGAPALLTVPRVAGPNPDLCAKVREGEGGAAQRWMEGEGGEGVQSVGLQL